MFGGTMVSGSAMDHPTVDVGTTLYIGYCGW